MKFDFIGLLINYLPFLFALCFHEWAHAWVARLKGDRTAEIMGRLTLSPLAHMDFIGTFLIPVLMFSGATGGIPLFGWAKPVPVNERNLQQPKKDMFWIALAGPLSNLFLATLGIFVYVFVKKFSILQSVIGFTPMLVAFIQINLALAFFNLIPFHPLDGGKVLARFLPYSANHWLEENQGILNVLLIILFVTGIFRVIAYPITWTAEIIFALANKVI